MKKLKIIFIFAILLFANVLLLEKVPAPAFCTWTSDCPTNYICSPEGGGGICVYQPGCGSSSDCNSGQYCNADGNCYNLQTCAEANTGVGYNVQESNEDLWGDCSISNTCTNQYTKSNKDGYCSGSTYSCKSATTSPVTTGDVCELGISVNPDGGASCGTGAQACYCDNDWYQCDLVNDCTYDQYYVGFTGSGTCTQTGKVLRSSNVANTDPNRCKIASTTAYQLTSSVWDTSSCNGGSGFCSAGSCVSSCPTLAGNTFSIKNSIGTTCFEVDITGDALIHGTLIESCTTAPPADSFIVKFGTQVRGWVRDTDCETCIYGTASASQSVTYAAPDGIYVKNSGGSYVMKWDTNGALKFTGDACYDKQSFSCEVPEIRHICVGGTITGAPLGYSPTQCRDFCEAGGSSVTCCYWYDDGEDFLCSRYVGGVLTGTPNDYTASSCSSSGWNPI